MEGAVRLWDRKAGSATIVQQSGVSYATLSPDGKVIACGGRGNHVRLYEGPTGAISTAGLSCQAL